MSRDDWHLPEDVLARPEMREACARRDFQAVFKLAGKYGGFTASRIARQCELTPTRVGEVIQGRRKIEKIDVIERISQGLGIPGHMLGLATQPWETEDHGSSAKDDHPGESFGAPKLLHDPTKPAITPSRQIFPWLAQADEGWLDMRRRAFLAGSAGIAIPSVALDDLKHIIFALEDTRRYFDSTVVDRFREQITKYAANDGTRGPRKTLPFVLGIIGAIESCARQVKPSVRRELLSVGAESAEFVGWLYRDIGMPDMAGYWQDRAIEWAQESGDGAMQGYVLLKKSQTAWDERDAIRMLTLAQAVQEGPWELPRKVRAEAAQQEARAHAMLGDDLKLMERKLDEAHRLLAEGDQAANGRQLSPHYSSSLLAMQTAICYCEAGRPQRAVEIYQGHLSDEVFSRRDYGYFLSLKSISLAAAGEPDEASEVALQALEIAVATHSIRTMLELNGLLDRLKPWSNRAAVQELYEAMLLQRGL
ncbi:transcriptional regulator [Carbonactinospora thermoautotrophica]|uniref:XRE family transcriptional regulator n=2 Tax=Carbonactinospora thermoautotrophica TaxID=1469144 RepID=UPI00226EB864|nr:XRE family transcriptional regulator [Carbonactinospora thermoautotrophica]MCX9191647.1 transcriptional regulator [Carbonactinospora thermoautotrophica]